MGNTESTVQIIPYYAHPHVHTVIEDNTQYDETVAQVTKNSGVQLPYSTVVVTGADSGRDNTFMRFTDLETKKNILGAGNFTKYGQASLQADALFNGSTNVWICRVLPDNATYANAVFLAHFRKGKVLDDLGQETGKVRLEVKFSVENATRENVTGGATTEDELYAFAQKLASLHSDPQTGYMTVPLFYVASDGRGKYGNKYSMSLTRDIDAEKEYDCKMYSFNLVTNGKVTRITNRFSGSLAESINENGVSTLINDVIDQYATGSCPVMIYSFTDSITTIYDYYMKEIVGANRSYIEKSGATAEDLADLTFAQAIEEKDFDVIFGYQKNNKSGNLIPYYRNYSMKSTGAWKAPDLEVPNTIGATKPTNLHDWSSAFAGARVLVAADPLHDSYRWLYTVVNIDTETGNIIYDEGVETAIDAEEYDGINIDLSIGHSLKGGFDGDFEEVTVNGQTRQPNAAEMKLLLAREQVKAFRGLKDRKILSPARVDLDFIFDANYNMNEEESLNIDDYIVPLNNTNTVLTDKDAKVLSIDASTVSLFDVGTDDLNVKKAMYDLNEFRNKNGMTISNLQGAGCSLFLDCGLVGTKNIGASAELMAIINMMKDFTGRQTSVDLGYYDIYDPASGKRISVTATYKIAKDLVNHIVREGINRPYTYSYAQLTAIQKDDTYLSKGDMIRDSFLPDLDLIDWDVKELLYTNRINYWITSEEGRVVQRACQNTRQLEASALLEENNVRVLNLLKKNLEKACRGYLYQWNEPEVRKGYTEAQMQIYKPWIGNIVDDLDIRFTANEWEQERMIMHCFCTVKFRDIIKRIILEINIQRPTNNADSADTEGGEA